MSNFRLKGASGPVINQPFQLEKVSLIGRADDCNLRIDQEGVAPRHAEIRENDDGSLVLTNIDATAETLLNGEAIQQASLASGDEIRIANCRWVLQAPGLRPEKVLTRDAVKPKRSYIPWLIVGGLLAAAAVAWYQGLLPFPPLH
ncbi:FHA domain-containing protein [Pseudomonadota bacterium]